MRRQWRSPYEWGARQDAGRGPWVWSRAVMRHRLDSPHSFNRTPVPSVVKQVGGKPVRIVQPTAGDVDT